MKIFQKISINNGNNISKEVCKIKSSIFQLAYLLSVFDVLQYAV